MRPVTERAGPSCGWPGSPRQRGNPAKLIGLFGLSSAEPTFYLLHSIHQLFELLQLFGLVEPDTALNRIDVPRKLLDAGLEPFSPLPRGGRQLLDAGSKFLNTLSQGSGGSSAPSD